MNSSPSPPFRADFHVAQQARRDKLRFDPQPVFDFSTGSGDLHTALYKPDPFTIQSNLELLPYHSNNSQLYHGHELAQVLLPPVQPPPSLTLASNNNNISTGPLGPFTGYATILKGSRFLKPAQQLLEEFCIAVMGVNKGERLVCEELVDGVSSSSLSSSTEAVNGRGNSCKPEFEEKKAKLLYMQEEVCRRYKQYHQQMQMVVSSFESVPGLGSSTPYASQALKSVSRHFKRLKTVISNQLQQIGRMLGEDATSAPTVCRSVVSNNMRLPYMESNHPVWRPQRGLPERAVSVLRAWLFDHFLHPYPTDSDKHMLASQTGLSRNQVSNWFINARVRLWKPMVEEIHMLETKGKSGVSVPLYPTGTNKPSSKLGVSEITDTLDQNNGSLMEYGSFEPVLRERSTNQCMEVWQGDKESRGQEEVMEENMISFGGFNDAKIDHMSGGFGAVSLTLGLRHDGAYQQQQHQQQLRHFGGQMLHDFVG
ncbi:hypothetical protein LUZ60_012188 [Juncus effusus]|nr:hypothetical protein LUZ60_012188 [Juncus effusus]